MKKERKSHGLKGPMGMLQDQEYFLKGTASKTRKKGLLVRVFSVLQSIVFIIFGLVLIFFALKAIGSEAWHQLLIPFVIGFLVFGVGIKIFWNNLFHD